MFDINFLEIKNDVYNINLMFIGLPCWKWCVLERANDNQYGYNCHIILFYFIYRFVYFLVLYQRKIEGIWHFPSFNYVCMSNKWIKELLFWRYDYTMQTVLKNIFSIELLLDGIINSKWLKGLCKLWFCFVA